MKELSLNQMEMVSGGCKTEDLFAYGAFASYYGIQWARGGNPLYQLGWFHYTSKIFGCM
jgi:hypothetical protein